MKIKNILLSNKYGIYFLIQYINVSFSRFATILIRRKTLESGCRDRAGSMALRMGGSQLCSPRRKAAGERAIRIKPASIFRRRNQSVQLAERIERRAGRRSLRGAAPDASQPSERFVSPLRKWANGRTVTRLSS